MRLHIFSNILPITEFAKGGGGYVPPPDYEAQARANVMTQNNQARIDAENAQRKKDEEAAQRAKDIEASRGRVSSAYDSAKSYGSSQLRAKGLDDTTGYGQEIANLYGASLDRARSSAPEVVTDANALFSPSLYTDAYGTVRSTARQNLNKQLNQFAGDGFADQLFADTADDSVLQSILDTQKGSAKSALDSALARGQINDAGYQAGINEMGNQYKSGLAKANQTGLGVLSGYRKNLNDYAGSQRTRVDNYDFGDDFDPNAVKGRIDSMASGYRGSLEGDILGAIGDTNYFNTDTLLGKAGSTSGAVNGGASGGSSLSGLVTGQNSNTSLLGSPLDTSKSSTSKNVGI